MSAKSERFEMRVDESLIERIDEWRARQGDLPSRAEALRKLVSRGLSLDDRESLHVSDAERLLIALACDQVRAPRDRQLNPDFIMSSLLGGHHWALRWQHPGLFPSHVDDPATVTEVVAALDMWDFIEGAYARLDVTQKKRIEKEGGPWGKHVLFRGYDGNHEHEHLGVAHHLIREMGRFQRFKKRDLNSHAPTVGRYREMTKKFEGIRTKLDVGRELTVDEIIDLLNIYGRQ